MKNLRGYIFSLTFAVLTVLFVLTLKGTWDQTDSVEIMKNLSDAFCVAGVMLTGFGLLVFISNDGFFDIITYTAKRMTNVFRVNPDKKMQLAYFQYKLEKQDEPSTFSYLLIVGAILIIISLIFVWFYYQV